MYKEVNKKEAVEIYLAGGMVFAGSGQSLDRLGCFTLETVKNRSEIRYVADVEEEKKPCRVKKSNDEGESGAKKAEAGEMKTKPAVTPESEPKTLGEQIASLKDKGFSNKEIAEKLNIKANAVSANYYLYNRKKKKQAEKPEAEDEDLKWDEPEEDKGPRLPQKQAELKSTLKGGKTTSVDLAKAQALLEAGWTVEKAADEFNVYPDELGEALEKYRKESI